MEDINILPEYEVFQVLGKPFVTSIILELLSGPRRFTDLSHLIPQIDDSMLSYRITELVNQGIMKKHIGTTMQACVHYSLTPKGYALEPILVKMYDWENRWAQ